ncbi:lysophospholipid acyltransferase family protein [Phenylobacterium sp. LjRoot219]|uniref:lysophospholipid acyltransferase family protein n=1 Tax=Phenylobacterium sp. LjRoot219 TaxID=3342283 RepID=UPI003ECC55C1
MTPRKPHPVMAGAFERMCAGLFVGWCRLTVSGREHLPEGPFILCSNHQSHLDSVALMAATGGRFREFGLLAAQDYFFERPATHRLFSPLLNLIPVARTADRQALRHTLMLCRQFIAETQGNLIIYPEGGRSRSGALQPFKRGAAMFAAELGLPIVPAYVRGTRAVMPPGTSWPKPGGIEVRFGPPVLQDAGAPATRRGRIDATAADLERRVHELKAISGD